MKDQSLQYSDKSIDVLEGLEAVRKRPGMYIGSTDSRGLHHLAFEIIDNAVDEVLAGFCDRITVCIHKDESISISDNGRGIPIGKHESGRSTIEVIFTVLHAGGKFGQGGYQTSGGLHGVGAAVVNALSEWLEVSVFRDGKNYTQRFENNGKKVLKAKVETTNKNKRGTTIRFKPNDQVFKTKKFDYEIISQRVREASFLLKNLTVQFIDERMDIKETYAYPEGLKSFVKYLNEGKDTLHEVVSFEGEDNGIEIDFSFQFNESYTETMLSFVNNVRTIDGGTHETGARSALTRAINEYARNYNFLSEKDENLDGNDIREGLTAIVSVRIPEHLLQFEGQTKGRLGTPEARASVEKILQEHLSYFLEENSKLANLLIEKAIRAKEARDAARKAREEARNSKSKRQRDTLLSGKLTPAQSRNPSEKELYLVEGDSAGGSAKQGRDRKFQAILPLRGKVINTERASIEDIFKNEEIATIIHTIGAGVGTEFSIEDIQYDKVIIMTDADTDGAHIQVLLLTFFYRYMRKLIEEGKVYIALPPLYKIAYGKGKNEQTIYAWSDEELKKHTKKLQKNYTIQRYKGLGEMNADQLWETTMNPKTRTLIRVTIDDISRAEKRVSTLMGDRVAPRREWIERNVAFGLDEEENILENENFHS